MLEADAESEAKNLVPRSRPEFGLSIWLADWLISAGVVHKCSSFIFYLLIYLALVVACMKALVDAVLRGRFDDAQTAGQTSINKNKVVIFVSSTFTDTKTERNALIKGQYSFFWLTSFIPSDTIARGYIGYVVTVGLYVRLSLCPSVCMPVISRSSTKNE